MKNPHHEVWVERIATQAKKSSLGSHGYIEAMIMACVDAKGYLCLQDAARKPGAKRGPKKRTAPVINIAPTASRYFTAKQWVDIEKLYLKGGVTIDNLAQHFGKSRTTFERHFSKYGIKKPSAHDFRALEVASRISPEMAMIMSDPKHAKPGEVKAAADAVPENETNLNSQADDISAIDAFFKGE